MIVVSTSLFGFEPATKTEPRMMKGILVFTVVEGRERELRWERMYHREEVEPTNDTFLQHYLIQAPHD